MLEATALVADRGNAAEGGGQALPQRQVVGAVDLVVVDEIQTTCRRLARHIGGWAFRHELAAVAAGVTLPAAERELLRAHVRVDDADVIRPRVRLPGAL